MKIEENEEKGRELNEAQKRLAEMEKQKPEVREIEVEVEVLKYDEEELKKKDEEIRQLNLEIDKLGGVVEACEGELNSVRCLFESKQRMYLSEMEGECGKIRERGDRERKVLEGEVEELKWQRGVWGEEREEGARRRVGLEDEARVRGAELEKCRDERGRLEKECGRLIAYAEKKKVRTAKAVASLYKELK